MIHLGKDVARNLSDIFFHMKLEGERIKAASQFGWDRHLELVRTEPLEHNMNNGKRRSPPVLKVYTHKPRGKVYDRKGKR